MISYVLGFYFNIFELSVALIQKNKPEWQVGRWNGIGGKLEDGETLIKAMSREFEEETGVKTLDLEWHHFATLRAADCEVYCFTMSGSEAPVTKTDERVFWYPVKALQDTAFKLFAIPNLHWLIPMALDKTLVEADIKL